MEYKSSDIIGLVLCVFLSLFFFRSNENRVGGKDERSRLVLFQVPWVRARLVFFSCWREISESRRDPRRSRTWGCCTWVTILHAWRVTRWNPQATRSSALNTPARADARGDSRGSDLRPGYEFTLLPRTHVFKGLFSINFGILFLNEIGRYRIRIFISVFQFRVLLISVLLIALWVSVIMKTLLDVHITMIIFRILLDKRSFSDRFWHFL